MEGMKSATEPPVERSGLRERLKSATAADHRATEESMYGEAIMKGELTLDRYRHLLKAHYIFHSALEKAISAHAGRFAAMRPQDRRKAGQFHDDLLQLNEPLPPEEDLFAGWDFPELLGAAYVAEGSTLGGAVITRALQKNGIADAAGITPGPFGSYGERTGERWKEFLHFLEEHADAGEAACNGANRAFRLLRDVFDRLGSH